MMQAALRMKAAQESGDAEQMRGAARLNWQLWTIIQAELLEPDCPLPADLRSNALSLANFIDKHSMQFITDPQPEKMNVLISINRELAGGLFQTPSEPASGDTAPQSPPPAGGLTDTSV
ncbi:MAG: flagellar biosynthesis regulator FlaF [Rhodospirillales bacterium]